MRMTIAALACLIASSAWTAEPIVTNGDTLILNGAFLRLHGIDAPNTDQTCLDSTGAAWRCGIEARERLKRHIGAREVRCDDQGSDPNHPKRRFAICRIEGEAISLNQWLVREGWAMNLEPSAPGRFVADQDNARENRKGMWSGCFVSPLTLRRGTRATAKLLGASCPTGNTWSARGTLFPDRPTMPPGCAIKGKITARSQITSHRGIYHLESCRSHARTANPERWFCSEDEARAEGFRKSYTC